MKAFHLYKVKTHKDAMYKDIYVITTLKDTGAFNALIVRADLPYLVIPIYVEALYEIIDLGCPSFSELKSLNLNFLCTIKLATVLSGYLLESTRNDIGDCLRDNITQWCLCSDSESAMKYAGIIAMSLCRIKSRGNLENYVQDRISISKGI